MPFYEFKRSISLGLTQVTKEEKGKDGKVVRSVVSVGKAKDYLKGIREVPESLESDQTFLKYVELGLIVEAPEPKVPVVQNPGANAKRLLEKLEVKRAAEIKKSEEESKASSVEEVATKEEEQEAEQESEPSKKKYRKG